MACVLLYVTAMARRVALAACVYALLAGGAVVAALAYAHLAGRIALAALAARTYAPLAGGAAACGMRLCSPSGRAAGMTRAVTVSGGRAAAMMRALLCSACGGYDAQPAVPGECAAASRWRRMLCSLGRLRCSCGARLRSLAGRVALAARGRRVTCAYILSVTGALLTPVLFWGRAR
ncbi:hypothetical protein JKP88DRAFT_277023 [Tribonema minus]|uniref:Uncharacterized protein n=1 Tax=Tribonema minus TaxID=303371 RepID=A0A836CIB2_9STRA|nr:hypothetical protein JKP88DRAFT_277023 [Tribonema minus]